MNRSQTYEDAVRAAKRHARNAEVASWVSVAGALVAALALVGKMLGWWA